MSGIQPQHTGNIAMMSARARGTALCAWSTAPCMASSSPVWRGMGSRAAGRTHATAGPLSYELISDALEAGQEALSIWDAAGDRRPTTHSLLRNRREQLFAGGLSVGSGEPFFAQPLPKALSASAEGRTS